MAKRNRIVPLVAAVATGAGLWLCQPAAAGNYAVIVNAANSYAADGDAAKAQIKRLYLKVQRSWPGGQSAVPFGRDAGSAEQAAFEKDVLGMSNSAVDGHWLKLKQTSGETPPRGVGSARILIRQVGKEPGAFGVVTAAEKGQLGGDVKVLFEFE